MSRNILKDIMPKEHRTIREVPLPSGRRRSDSFEADSILYEQEEEYEVVTDERESSPWRRIILWTGTFFFLALVGVAFATSFSGATVTVVPRSVTAEVEGEFTASRDGTKLRFEALPISETAEITIPADTKKKVVERASGVIIIYNNFSEKPQRLVKNTRFETKNGLIYRIDASLTVPGRKAKDGKLIPGTIEATVFADSPGVEYNIPLSDFTVPGFKTDSARFAGFYARSKTPISGGFDGTITVPSDSALAKARASLRKTLAEKVSKGGTVVVPPGYIFLDGALATLNEALPPEEKDGGLSLIREKMTGAIYLFKKDEIAKAIASVSVSGFNNLPVKIPNLETLKFKLEELPTGNPAETRAIRFTLQGKAEIVWLYDAGKLKGALVGKQKDELLAILSNFPTIEKADLIIRPFWSRQFPDTMKKITIKENPRPQEPLGN